MLVDLILGSDYDGLLYLAEATRNMQRIESHHHLELEVNLVLQGTITYVMNGRRSAFAPRILLWIFPEEEHQLVDKAANARFYAVVFKQSLIEKPCHAAA